MASQWWQGEIGVAWCDNCGKEWVCHATAYYTGPVPSTCNACGAREVWWRETDDARP